MIAGAFFWPVNLFRGRGDSLFAFPARTSRKTIPPI
jgi:hypothetical protein